MVLSEAEWRCGNEEAADAAAELARSAAVRQGSDHILLSALAQFPDVLARRIDLESGSDSTWHELGRALLVRGIQVPEVGSATVEVAEFGRPALTVGGVEVSPGLSKSFELLAYLADGERDEVSREHLLDVLFDGRRDASTTAYLRQAALKLRRAVPDVLDASGRPGTLRLSASVRVTTESRRLISLLGEAAAMRGEERLALLLAALEIADRGAYLPNVSSVWAEDRRRRLDDSSCAAPGSRRPRWRSPSGSRHRPADWPRRSSRPIPTGRRPGACSCAWPPPSGTTTAFSPIPLVRRGAAGDRRAALRGDRGPPAGLPPLAGSPLAGHFALLHGHRPVL